MRNISRSEDRLSWELVEWAERSECGVGCLVFGVHFGVSLLLLLTEEQTQREISRDEEEKQCRVK